MRKEKQFLLDDAQSELESSSAFLLTSYQGMDPNLTSEFRSMVCETGGFFKVVKKRIFLKAAAEAGVAVEAESLKGHIGVVYAGEDMIATTKGVYKFTDTNKGLLEVLGGLFEGKMCSSSEFKEISKLPSKEQMRAEFLGLLAAPMSGTLGAIDALLSGLVSCVDQKAEKES